MKPTLIVYGNCQADAVASILKVDPVVSDAFEVIAYRSFDDPLSGRGEISAEQLSRCALLLEQSDPDGFPLKGQLSEQTPLITFPAIDFNLLWPFNCVNRYNGASVTPRRPWGRFPYGDRIIMNMVDAGLPKDEIARRYFDDDSFVPDLNRLYQLEVARLLARDARCDVKMSKFILEKFRSERLFWCVNHPNVPMLIELVSRLLHSSVLLAPAFDGVDVQRTMTARFPADGPLGILSVPIHPAIVNHFELNWYKASGAHQSFEDSPYTYSSYFETMIETMIEARSATAEPEVIAKSEPGSHGRN